MALKPQFMLAYCRQFYFTLLCTLSIVVGTTYVEAQPVSDDLRVSLLGSAVSFLSSDYDNTDQKTFTFLGLGLEKNKSSEAGASYGLDIKGWYGVNSLVLSHLNPKELYGTYLWSSHPQYRFTYGRKLEQWSSLDESWGLGFFQPQFRWNSLDIQTQGLTGFFYSFDSKINKQSRLNFMFYASPIYLPDQGPGYELNDGQFLKTNPWFQIPPNQVDYQNQLFPIDYNVNMPKVKDLLFQTSYGGKIKVESPSNWYIQGSAINKPSHQLALGFKGALVADRVKVDLLPMTYREILYGLDVGYKNNDNEITLGFLSVNPENIKFDLPYNYPVIESSFSWGPKLSLGLNDNWVVSLSGLITHGGEITEQGPDAGSIQTPLTYKYMYKSGYKLALSYKKYIFDSIKMNTQVQWIETYDNWSKMLKFYSSFGVNDAWSLVCNLMLIETNSTPSSLSNMRNLDQVWLGASYDF